MADRMSSKERVLATIAGEEVDRPPLSVWRHFYHHERSTDGLVEAMLGFQRRFGWDFMKVNPRAHYHVEDWGVRYAYPADPNVAPSPAEVPVKSAEDWGRIQPLDPSHGILGEHLLALRRIGQGMPDGVPYVMTVFTPLSVAGMMAESEQTMLKYMQESPDRLRQALEAVTQTFERYVPLCLEAGASGIFFATTRWATYNRLTEEQYRTWGRPYDLRVLAAAQQAPFNILHVCRSRNMLLALADYPVEALNWDVSDPTNPSIREGSNMTDKVVIGGIPHTKLDRIPISEAEVAARDALSQARGRRFMLGPGCTIPPTTPETVLDRVKAIVTGEPTR